MASLSHRVRLAGSVLRQRAPRTSSPQWTYCKCAIPLHRNISTTISRQSLSSQFHTSARPFADTATTSSAGNTTAAAAASTDATIPTDAEVAERVINVIKKAEKVDANKVTIDSQFTSDLGLDSLDVVEVIMAVEDEFNIEIPDADADAMTTPKQTIEFVKNAVKKKAA